MSTPKDNVDSSDAIMLLREIFNGGATVPAATNAPDSSATVDVMKIDSVISLTVTQQVALMKWLAAWSINLSQVIMPSRNREQLPLATALIELMNSLTDALKTALHKDID